MPTIENFLQHSVEQIRQSVIDIDDSYNNDWDILAELVQNSVDAVRKAKRTDGAIEIVVDSQNRTISVKDNGIGIEPGSLPKLLSMFGTDKRGDEGSIGEKGVGLKFAIFSCNDFFLKTVSNGKAAWAKVKDAYNWKKSSEEKFLPLEHEEINNDFEGTEVTLKDIPECAVFDLNFVQLKYILRTKTAIGNTTIIWEPSDIDISVTLKYKSPQGEESKEKVPFRYLLPIENIGNNDKISLTEYLDYIKEDKTDQQKRGKLKNKIIYQSKTFDDRNRKIYAWACLVPKRATWGVLSQTYNLVTEEDLKSEAFLETFGYATFQPGIFTSVKGMPTGIRVEHPLTGSTGTWGQIFMIFEDRRLKFDIGRKSIHGKTAKVYQEYSRDLFNELRNLVFKYVSGDVTPESTSWDRDEIFKEIDSLIDLPNSDTKFKKTPREQEGTVAGLFFEAIGNGKITEITPLISGYKNKYDLYALWGNKRVAIEFKSQLYKIIKDFNDETKLFNEVDCVVCWDVSEDDMQEFKDVGIALEPIPDRSILNPSDERFPHSTHTLRYSAFIKPIYVIDMKTVIKKKS